VSYNEVYSHKTSTRKNIKGNKTTERQTGGQKHISHKVTHGIAKSTKNTFLSARYRAIVNCAVQVNTITQIIILI